MTQPRPGVEAVQPPRKLEEVRTSPRTIISDDQKILKRAQLMEDEITRRIGSLADQLEPLCSLSGDSQPGLSGDATA